VCAFTDSECYAKSKDNFYHEGDVTISAFFTLHAFYIGNEVPDKYLPYNLQDFRMQ
jgi:vomeronasal 2 receptor